MNKKPDDDLFIEGVDDLFDDAGVTTPKRQPRKRGQRFAQLDLTETAVAFKALGCPAAVVWVALVYRAWAAKSDTVPLTSQMLADLGINREVKRRALKRLEAAGLIRVKCRYKKNPLVTLLRPR